MSDEATPRIHASPRWRGICMVIVWLTSAAAILVGLAAAPYAAAQGEASVTASVTASVYATAPAIQAVSPSAPWNDAVLAKAGGAMGIAGSRFGSVPGEVLIQDGQIQLVADLAQGGLPGDCTWTSTAVTLGSDCFNQQVDLPVGTAAVQLVTAAGGQSNVATIAVVPTVQTLVLSATPSVVPAGGQAEFTVRAAGPAGAAIGYSINLAVSSPSGSAQLSTGQVTTGVAGAAEFSVTDPNPEQVTVTAKYANRETGNTVIQQATVSFTGGCNVVSSVQVAVLPGALPTQGAAGIPVTASLTTAAGAPVAGAPVLFAAPQAPGVTISPSEAETNASGVATVAVSSTEAQNVSLTATCASVPGPSGSPPAGSATIQFQPAPQVVLQLQPASFTEPVGAPDRVQVQAITPAGGPLGGIVVTLQPYQTLTVNAATVTTQPDGEATFTATATQTGTATVTATASGAAPSAISIQFGAASPTTGTGCPLSEKTCIPPPPPPEPCVSHFRDVAPAAWYTQAVCALTSRGVIQGFACPPAGSTCFAPNTKLTVAEWSALIVRAVGLGIGSNTPNCSANNASWARGDLAAMAPYLVDVARVEGTCRASDVMNRELAIASLVRVVDAEKYPLPAGPGAILAPFADGGRVASAVRSLVAIGIQLHLLEGGGGARPMLYPTQPLTRAAAAVLLYRAMTNACLGIRCAPRVNRVTTLGQPTGGLVTALHGTGLGEYPAYDGQTQLLWFDDATSNWQAGKSGGPWNEGNLNVTLWTPWLIEIVQDGSNNNYVPAPGDTVTVHLVNPESQRAAAPYTFQSGQRG